MDISSSFIIYSIEKTEEKNTFHTQTVRHGHGHTVKTNKREEKEAVRKFKIKNNDHFFVFLYFVIGIYVDMFCVCMLHFILYAYIDFAAIFVFLLLLLYSYLQKIICNVDPQPYKMLTYSRASRTKRDSNYEKSSGIIIIMFCSIVI